MAPEYYIFTGRDAVPRHVTHILIDRSLKFIPVQAFYGHPSIQEVECHHGVEKIEREAFCKCSSLRRVIMQGVKVVEKYAFDCCRALTSIECDKLEIIEDGAFHMCAMRSVDLPSIKIVGNHTFESCKKLTSANFGEELQSIRGWAFKNCISLERITIPLKDGLIGDDYTFLECRNLNRVDLIGGVHETITALLLEEWKNDMNKEINAINQNLLYADAGGRVIPNSSGQIDPGGKARVIRTWIRSLLRKTAHYKAEHCRCLNVAAATLELVLPNDIVFKNVIPFLELPS